MKMLSLITETKGVFANNRVFANDCKLRNRITFLQKEAESAMEKVITDYPFVFKKQAFSCFLQTRTTNKTTIE